jgi:hypothetical protein
MAKQNDAPSPTPKPIGCDKKRMYVEIPYVGQTIDSMKKKFAHLSGKLRPDLDVGFFMKPPPSVRTFLQNRESIAEHMQSNIVYSVNCQECWQAYVGKTDRQAIRRINEHGTPSDTFDPSPPTTKPKPLPKRSARIVNKAIAKNSNILALTNANNSDTGENKDKVMLSALS